MNNVYDVHHNFFFDSLIYMARVARGRADGFISH